MLIRSGLLIAQYLANDRRGLGPPAGPIAATVHPSFAAIGRDGASGIDAMNTREATTLIAARCATIAIAVLRHGLSGRRPSLW